MKFLIKKYLTTLHLRHLTDEKRIYMAFQDKIILCIEDDTHLRVGLKDILELEGYQIVEAETGVDGLEKVIEFKPDLIICDIMMPKMDGYAFLKELRGLEVKLSIIPVIFLTGKGERNDVRFGMKSGVDDYVIKPYDPENLLLRVETVLMRREMLTAAIQLVERELNYHVFLSYSRKDKTISEQVCKALRNSNLKVWIDTDELKPGTASWKKEVQKAIEQAGCIVVLLSPDAKGSKWVEAELDYAETQEKIIIPLLISGKKSTSVPFGFTVSHLIDISGNNFETGVENLVVAIRNQLGLL